MRQVGCGNGTEWEEPGIQCPKAQSLFPSLHKISVELMFLSMLPKVSLYFLIYCAQQCQEADTAHINIFILKLKKSSLRSVSCPLLYIVKWKTSSDSKPGRPQRSRRFTPPPLPDAGVPSTCISDVKVELYQLSLLHRIGLRVHVKRQICKCL